MSNPAKQPDAATLQTTDNLVSTLRVMASQIQAALHETEAPAATLVESVDTLAKATQTVARCLFDFSGSPARVFQDLMVLHDELHARAAKAATAIQFHDRLNQSLMHVCSALTYLAEIVSSGNGPKSAAEWNALRERIRTGQNNAEAPQLKRNADGASKVELF